MFVSFQVTTTINSASKQQPFLTLNKFKQSPLSQKLIRLWQAALKAHQSGSGRQRADVRPAGLPDTEL